MFISILTQLLKDADVILTITILTGYWRVTTSLEQSAIRAGNRKKNKLPSAGCLILKLYFEKRHKNISHVCKKCGNVA